MPDYSKGKIYKIVVDTVEKYKPYVGSSCQELSQRMTDHRKKYKEWKEGKFTKCSSYDLFDKFGIENCQIILLEEFSCKNISQLLMKEREWFDKIENCNQKRPYVSNEERVEYLKEWREEHKEEIAEKAKEQYQKNKEQISEKNKIYCDEHKDQIAEKAKEWYKEHKKQIAKKGKEKFECDCGSICRKSDKAKHEKTQKHQNWLKSL